jgi:hypothetical protein
MMVVRKRVGVNMSGAAWNPKNKTPEQEWDELVIMKNEYYDIMEVPTLEEYKTQQWNVARDSGTEPNGLAACMGWNLKIEREYKIKYHK